MHKICNGKHVEQYSVAQLLCTEFYKFHISEICFLYVFYPK